MTASQLCLNYCQQPGNNSFGGGNEKYFSVALGECALDSSDNKQWWGNYQWQVAISAVVACRPAVVIRCERGIKVV